MKLKEKLKQIWSVLRTLLIVLYGIYVVGVIITSEYSRHIDSIDIFWGMAAFLVFLLIVWILGKVIS